jgi:hypothetical protein
MTHFDHDVQILLDRYPLINDDLVTCDTERCTSNVSQPPSVWNDDNEVPYLINIRCTICHQIWTLCKECKLKKKLLKHEQVTTHKWKYHRRIINKRKINVLANKATEMIKKKKCDETDDIIGK